MSQGWDYTLESFVRDRVATPEEWKDWQRVRTATGPQMKAEWKGQDLYHVSEDPSADYKRREELLPQLIQRTREKIFAQEWEVSGRPPRDMKRQILEPFDIERAEIDIDASTIGPFRDVRLRRRLRSKMAVMTDFIEKVCLTTNPGAKLTKPVIETLAKQLCGDDYSDNAFAAAWDEADIDERWRRKGPR